MNIGGEYQNSVMYVTPKTMDKAQLAARVMETIQSAYLPHGAGNQLASVVGSKGESFANTVVMRDEARQLRGRLTGFGSKPQYVNAHIAATYKGGQCEEIARLVYAELAKRGSKFPVSIATFNPTGKSEDKHIVALLGDPLGREKDSTVVVDAWQHFPVVTLLDKTRFPVTPDPDMDSVHFQVAPGPDAAKALDTVVPYDRSYINNSLREADAFSGSDDDEKYGSLDDKNFVARNVSQYKNTMWNELTIAADPSTRFTTDSSTPAHSWDSVRGDIMMQRLNSVAEYDKAYKKDNALYTPARKII
nr:hypothetical protein [Pantoea sp. 201603H]